MDRGSSSEEEDSEDNVPLAHALGIARPKPVLVTSKSATAASTASTAATAATAASKTTQVSSKRPLAARASMSGSHAKRSKMVPAPAPKPQPKPGARPVLAKAVPSKPSAAASYVPEGSKPAAKPQAKHVSSTASGESSSESDDDDLSGGDDDEGTSSEEDDESEDDDDAAASVPARRSISATTTPRAPPPPASAAATTAVPAIPVGILVSSPARTAVERLDTALQALDSTSAPLSAQAGIQKSKRALSGDVSAVIQKLSDGNRLTDAHVSSLLCATSLVAMNLASVAAGPDDVDREIQSFRRAAHQMHAAWDTTLPQLEALADASRKQQEAAAHASRVAAELLGSHAALANAVANALEGLKRGR